MLFRSQRISLSLRQAMADDQPVKTPEEGEEESADEAAPTPRTPTPNLRGGIGGQGWSLPQLPE